MFEDDMDNTGAAAMPADDTNMEEKKEEMHDGMEAGSTDQPAGM